MTTAPVSQDIVRVPRESTKQSRMFSSFSTHLTPVASYVALKDSQGVTYMMKVKVNGEYLIEVEYDGAGPVVYLIPPLAGSEIVVLRGLTTEEAVERINDIVESETYVHGQWAGDELDYLGYIEGDSFA